MLKTTDLKNHFCSIVSILANLIPSLIHHTATLVNYLLISFSSTFLNVLRSYKNAPASEQAIQTIKPCSPTCGKPTHRLGINTQFLYTIISFYEENDRQKPFVIKYAFHDFQSQKYHCLWSSLLLKLIYWKVMWGNLPK